MKTNLIENAVGELVEYKEGMDLNPKSKTKRIRRRVIGSSSGPPWCALLKLECGHTIIYRRQGIKPLPKKAICNLCET